MKDVEVLDGWWAYTHLDDLLASQYQSLYWTQPSTLQAYMQYSNEANLLAPGCGCLRPADETL